MISYSTLVPDTSLSSPDVKQVHNMPLLGFCTTLPDPLRDLGWKLMRLLTGKSINETGLAHGGLQLPSVNQVGCARLTSWLKRHLYRSIEPVLIWPRVLLFY